MVHPIPLRPHHGMCFQYFVGEGYSDNFTENMYKVHSKLSKNPMIRLQTSPDVVCGPCPNCEENSCQDEDLVARYDRQVLDLCNLKDNLVISWTEFSRRVKNHILDTKMRESICGDCEWTDLCK